VAFGLDFLLQIMSQLKIDGRQFRIDGSNLCSGEWQNFFDKKIFS
jgi:hypothetical protein